MFFVRLNLTFSWWSRWLTNSIIKTANINIINTTQQNTTQSEIAFRLQQQINHINHIISYHSEETILYYTFLAHFIHKRYHAISYLHGACSCSCSCCSYSSFHDHSCLTTPRSRSRPRSLYKNHRHSSSLSKNKNKYKNWSCCPMTHGSANGDGGSQPSSSRRRKDTDSFGFGNIQIRSMCSFVAQNMILVIRLCFCEC